MTGLVCRGERNSLRQGVWQRNFSGSRIKGTVPAGLAKLRQRVAANSRRPRGRESSRPAQGNISTLAGNSQDRARNRRPRRNPDANVSCRSFFGRSLVDGANFDGKIDRIRSWLYKLRLPARFARGFFCADLLPARPSFRLIPSGRVNPHPAGFRVGCASETFPALALNR